MKIVVLPGDDIGPEITEAAIRVVDAVNNRFALGLEFEWHEVGMVSHRKTGTTLSAATVEAAMAADGVILGPAGITNYPPVEDGGINVPATIRKRLDLFANIRPFKARLGLPNARDGLDLVFVRENTEGFYSDRNMFAGTGEFMPTPEIALSVRKITAGSSRRIAEVAFDIARRRRGRVTAVGKEHALRLSDGLFMREARSVAARYPGVEFRDMDVDAFAAAVYSTPQDFDVVLTTNMFGDILSNLGAAMAGGLGLSGALNAGESRAAANAGHGSAPDIAGRGLANPAGLITSAALLLAWLGERSGRAELSNAGAAIERSVDKVLSNPEKRTVDLGGRSGTRDFCDAVVESLGE